MADLVVTRKNFVFQYRGGASLSLGASTTPWQSNVLRLYRESSGQATALQSYAGAYGGQTAGGSVTTLVPGYCYRIIVGLYDGSWSIPDSVLVDNIPINGGSLPGNVKLLSTLGIVSDADLSMHPTTTGNDQTAKIAAILDGLDHNTMTLVINDCAFSTDRLVASSNLDWLNMPNCGVVQRVGVAESLLQNKNPAYARGTAPIVSDKNVTFRGGIFNGNGRDANGNLLRPIAATNTGFCSAYYFRGVDNFSIRDCEIRNVASIMGSIANFTNWLLSNVQYKQSPTIKPGQLCIDGPKHMGPYANCIVQDCVIDNKGDDRGSWCAVDGYFPTPGHNNGVADCYDLYACYGVGTNTIIRRNYFPDGPVGQHGLRFLDVGQGLNGILIEGNTGSCGEFVAVFDRFTASSCFYAGGSTTATFNDVVIRNNSFSVQQNATVNPYVKYQANISGIDGAGIFLQCVSNSFTLENNFIAGCNASNYPALLQTADSAIASLRGNNFAVDGISSPLTACTLLGTITTKTGNLFGVTAANEVDITTGLICNYKFSDLNDSGPFGLALTAFKGAAVNAGALRLSHASGQYVRRQHQNPDTLTNGFTVAGRLTVGPNNGGSSDTTLTLGKFNTDHGQVLLAFFRASTASSTTGQFKAFSTDANGNISVLTGPVKDYAGKTVPVALRFDKNNFWMNLEKGNNIGVAQTSLLADDSALDWTFGSDQRHTLTWDGALDDWYVFNRPLNDNSLAALPIYSPIPASSGGGVTAYTIEETDAAFTESGTWAKYDTSAAYAGSCRYCNDNGGYYQFTMPSGGYSNVTLQGYGDEYAATFDVYVNGTKTTSGTCNTGSGGGAKEIIYVSLMGLNDGDVVKIVNTSGTALIRDEAVFS
ncbi:hypothetical protein HHL22_20530 [Hymenobacter sp. RP-2-7]|uniref:Uncharacterized protein n=1 Tax=Hymenobacter polaris TaxID=2682546 RepID=A0A7Y0AHQ4_9BACT|nr:hypothetical protein [Hymenobacter polaris]NML67594.1 hypothetical protein [Hymenobacter polaris]